ncbi:MAG: hypothetical protein M3R48_04830 [Candidatus Dormibacteraeota bacterium]|nr:hypothetical protein [Candidatus Dormibacteraeota bacterium]
MTRRRGALAVIGLSLAALVAIRAGGGGPPLYDGICLPVTYQSLGANPPPTSVTKVITVQQQFPTVVVNTTEAAPQAQVIFESGTFTVPPGSAVTVTIKAVEPPSTKPADGTLEGNVYEIVATGPGGSALQPAAGKPATVALASPVTGGTQPVIEHYDGSRWTALATVQSGCATTEEAASPSLGPFALVVPSGSTGSPGSSGSGGGLPAPVVVGGGLVLAVALLLGGLRLSRRRR